MADIHSNIEPIFVVSDNKIFENGQRWTIDSITIDFKKYSGLVFTDDLVKAKTIWILAGNIDVINQISTSDLTGKIIITTIHDINQYKGDNFLNFFKLVDSVTTYYHSPCDITTAKLATFTHKKIITACFWVNQTLFYNIPTKTDLRKKYNIPTDAYVIGSFQCDTLDDKVSPKLEKGPDILVNVMKDHTRIKQNVFILLTGRMRQYVIDKLDSFGIRYLYMEMVDVTTLNELYNCLDIYYITSREEGGPRAILECAITKCPVVSRNVGMASLILTPKGMTNGTNHVLFRYINPDPVHAYEKAQLYTLDYMPSFIKSVFIMR